MKIQCKLKTENWKLSEKNRAGFSLMEATIVLFLFAVTASLFATLSFNSLNSRFYDARETLKNDLRRAKGMALHPLDAAAGFCGASLRMDANAYTLFYNQSCDGVVGAGDIIVESKNLSGEILISSAPFTVNFKIPYGEAYDEVGAMYVSERSVIIKTTNNQFQSVIKITPLGQIYQ